MSSLEEDPSQRGVDTTVRLVDGGWSEPSEPKEGKDNGFRGKDVLFVNQFDRQKLSYIFGVAETMRRIVKEGECSDLLYGKILANLFYEPSTRTSSSFLAAMQRLGGGIIPINEMHYSSVAKGESLPDTIRTLECYADVIVLRHPEVGSAQIAADVAEKPIINAGDGTGEHPTQALLDIFTIQRELGTIDGLNVVMVGDLANGRTVHSLAVLLSLYNVDFHFVSPPFLHMPNKYKDELARKGRNFQEHASLDEVIGGADVLYVTRVQKERFEAQGLTEAQYEEARQGYIVDPLLLQKAKEKMIVMHPLPRVGEISPAVDQDPRAAYFRQMENGMYIRMALLAAVLGRA